MSTCRLLTLVLVLFMFAAPARASFIMNIYIVPPPDEPEIDVRIDFFDADDGASLGGDTKHIDGSTSFKVSVAPNKDTKRIKVKFAPFNIKIYNVKPAERIVDLAPLMQAKTITWIASIAADKAYLDNVTTAAGSLKKKDIEGAIDRASYAGAVAETDNQRLEAARVEANGYVAKSDPWSALAVFDRVVTEGIEKADASKKKVFVGEWLDVLEIAATAEGVVPDKKTGLVFGSLPANSKVRGEFNKFVEVFGRIVPGYKEKTAGVSALDIEAKERVVRAEMWIILKQLARR